MLELISQMQQANISEYEKRQFEFEQLAEEFVQRGKKARDAQKQQKLMNKMSVKLFEGTFDSRGKYTPGKFEFLTMPSYY